MTDFAARSLRGDREIPLSDYTGRVVLVVNTASECGFTPQFAGLEALYERHGDQGFVVLGFPCNQFGGQEPGGADQIEASCQLRYGVSFPMFEKIEVNGPNAHPMFKWLTRSLPGLFGPRIRWNFTKFLIDRSGEPLRRFAPITKPERIERFVVRALGQANAG
ncbi:MAG TPA: glutathione peroxidase [Burkholderiaceae bacterium]|nr:glutathione peroxidase [Burkholderiaceae bacterium]